VNLLWPRIPRRQFVAMLRIAAIGAVVAAVYGVLHDQISYAISTEYFTKLKFDQFAWADFGWPRRAFVAEVGALGSWWVGMIAGWALGRVGFADPGAVSMRDDVLRAFGLVVGVAVAGGAIGLALGCAAASGDVSGWDRWRENLALDDVPAFVRVAWLHGGGYVGGAVGIVVAVLDARRRRPPAGPRVASIVAA
jgi:hypothetical protein